MDLSVFKYELMALNGFADPESFQDFRETGPSGP